MAKKADAIRRVMRLWKMGEKANACAAADAAKLKEADWPDGMAAFRQERNL